MKTALASVLLFAIGCGDSAGLDEPPNYDMDGLWINSVASLGGELVSMDLVDANGTVQGSGNVDSGCVSPLVSGVRDGSSFNLVWQCNAVSSFNYQGELRLGMTRDSAIGTFDGLGCIACPVTLLRIR